MRLRLPFAVEAKWYELLIRVIDVIRQLFVAGNKNIRKHLLGALASQQSPATLL